MKVTKMKGTLDYFDASALKYQYLEEKAQMICKRFGFNPMITPIFEATELFVRGVGEGSDIVNKEMYTFLDKGNRSITLRPEGTASVTRCYVENKLYAEPGLKKYYYFGPMFRYERPQAGRYRQFNQFGIEALGPGSSYLDAEIINLASSFLKEIGLDKVKVLINNIGSGQSRENYCNALKDHFAQHLDQMCDDCKVRFAKNPLRMLDCKVDKESEIMKSAPRIFDYLTKEDQLYFEQICHNLETLGVKYQVDDRLVRGLDYYTNVVFEFVYDDDTSPINGLTVLAGGRYNGLSKELGGPDTEAIGFACGIERLILVLDELNKFNDISNNAFFQVITIGEACKIEGIKIANELRKNNFYVEIDYVNHNLKPQFKLSERTHAKYLIIIGEEEVANQIYKVKNTWNNTEMSLTLHQILELK
ncbi:MAG: histidine--tRNA ligase [Bacilli bacterium]